ncbi:hypothetical protein ACFFRR_001987 [Megaselia abdita]
MRLLYFNTPKTHLISCETLLYNQSFLYKIKLEMEVNESHFQTIRCGNKTRQGNAKENDFYLRNMNLCDINYFLSSKSAKSTCSMQTTSFAKFLCRGHFILLL